MAKLFILFDPSWICFKSRWFEMAENKEIDEGVKKKDRRG
jgi:hypothetical protein